MRDLNEGKYFVQLATGPRTFVGVNDIPGSVIPVVTEGEDNVVSPPVFAQR